MEDIYYVNSEDQPTGQAEEKYAAHHSNTKLHAAFSCYVFNEKGQFLITQRAYTKKVWPGFWTNSVCGHPMPDETREDAIKRRLDYELGMRVSDLDIVITNYRYKTPPYSGIIENEYCPVFVALAESDPQPNPDEVSGYEWVDWGWFVDQAEADSDDYSMFAEKIPEQLSDDMPKWSWWCKDQIKQLKTNPKFQKLLESIS